MRQYLNIWHIEMLLLSLFLMLLATSPLYADSLLGIAETLDGQTLGSLKVSSHLALKEKDLSDSLKFRPGDTISKKVFLDSVESLYQRDVFSHVDFAVNCLANKVCNLEIMLVPARFIAGVYFEGNSNMRSQELLRAARFRKGMNFEVSTLKGFVERIKAFYATHSYNDTIVKVTVEESLVPYINVLVEINEGRPTNIGKIIIEGISGSNLSEMEERVRDKFSALPLTQSVLKALRMNVLVLLRKKGFLQALVESPVIRAGEQKDEKDLILKVYPREPLRFVFRGATVFSESELLKPLRLNERTLPVSPLAVKSLERSILKMYQDRGFAFAKVAYRRLPSEENETVFEINIDEGTQAWIDTIAFTGNQSFDEKVLLENIESVEESIWPWKKRGFLNIDRLKEDSQSLEAYYRSRGFWDVQVSYELSFESQKRRDVRVIFIVNEGERKKVKRVSLRWESIEKAVTTGETAVLGLLSMPPPELEGAAIVEDEIERVREELEETISRRGFPLVIARVEVDEETSSLRFVINPGPFVSIGQIIFSGNTFTHDEILRQALLVQEGDLWDRDLVRRSEQSLYRLGLFSGVEVRAGDFYPDSRDEALSVKVVERESGKLEYGVSYHTQDGLRLSGELSQRNLHGSGNSLIVGFDLFLKAGNSSRFFNVGSARVIHKIPNIIADYVDLNNEVYSQFSVQQINQYNYDQSGYSPNLIFLLGDKIKAKTGVRAYWENLFDVNSGAIIGKRDTGSTVYSMPFVSLDIDYRDDRFNPRSGWHLLWDAGLNSSYFGSQVDFVSTSLQQTAYLSPLDYLVLAANSRIAFLNPYNGTSVIPLSHREFLGGRTSLRGFQINAVGPVSPSGVVVGGDFSVLLSTEMQFLLSDNSIFMLFLDAGQAYLKSKGGFNGKTQGISDLSYSPGLGFRYVTPIGPLELSYGFKSDRGGNLEPGRLNFGIGTGF